MSPEVQTLAVALFWFTGISVLTHALVGTLRLLRKGY